MKKPIKPAQKPRTSSAPVATQQQIVLCSILEGQSVSHVVNLLSPPRSVMCVFMPDAWDDALLTFQVSTDGSKFVDLFLADGFELSIKPVPGSAVNVQRDWLQSVCYLKLRSGSRADPVAQSAQRTFGLLMA